MRKIKDFSFSNSIFIENSIVMLAVLEGLVKMMMTMLMTTMKMMMNMMMMDDYG